MIKKHEKLKSLLFDGDESGVINKTFNLPQGIVNFNDFAGNNFESLVNVIGADDFKAIISSAGFKTDGGFLNLYQGSEGLRLYYAKKGNIIFVFAFGEFQPTRYKLYVEGVWAL